VSHCGILNETSIHGVSKHVLVMLLRILCGKTSYLFVGTNRALIDSGSISVKVASGAGLGQYLILEEVFVEFHLLIVSEVSQLDLHTFGVLFPILQAELFDFIDTGVSFGHCTFKFLLLALAK